MVNLYYTLVKEGLRTIEQVPLKYREDVQVKLNEQ